MSRSEREKARRDRRRAAGRCPGCGREPQPGGVQCERCVEKCRRWRAAARQEGVCRLCRAPAVAGLTVCADCARHDRLRVRRRRDLARREGRCTVCGRSHPGPGVNCAGCRARHAAWRKQQRARS